MNQEKLGCLSSTKLPASTGASAQLPDPTWPGEALPPKVIDTAWALLLYKNKMNVGKCMPRKIFWGVLTITSLFGDQEFDKQRRPMPPTHPSWGLNHAFNVTEWRVPLALSCLAGLSLQHFLKAAGTLASHKSSSPRQQADWLSIAYISLVFFIHS